MPENIAEVSKIENADDRRERALEEMTRDVPGFATRLDKAIKIIHDDRMMFIQYSNIPADQRPSCTYADARKSLIAMLSRAGNQTVDGYKYALELAVQHVANEGRRYQTREDVEKAFQSYKTGGHQ